MYVNGARKANDMRKNFSVRKHGVTLMEILVASVILTVGIAGSFSLANYTYTITNSTDSAGAAYNLGRRTLEEAKLNGFDTLAEGVTTNYYDTNETPVANSAGSAYIVTITVKSNPAPNPTVDPTSLRAVTLNVQSAATNAILYSTTTYLASGGA